MNWNEFDLIELNSIQLIKFNSCVPSEHVRPSDLFGRRSYFVEFYVLSSWFNTQFCRFSGKPPRTELFAELLNAVGAIEMLHDCALYKFTIDIDIDIASRGKAVYGPSQASPSGISSWPSAHWHSKLPTVLAQCPPRHKLGSREHSSISAKT